MVSKLSVRLLVNTTSPSSKAFRTRDSWERFSVPIKFSLALIYTPPPNNPLN